MGIIIPNKLILKKLLIIGAGSFATEIEELAHLLGYQDIAFLDDNPDKARCTPIIGKIADISKFRGEYEQAICAMGNNEARMRYHKMLEENGFEIPVLIHPTAFVSADAKLAPGCIVRTRAVVSRYVQLGKACIVNVGALIDHDCVIGEGTHCLMGCVVRNSVTVEPMTWIRANEVVE